MKTGIWTNSVFKKLLQCAQMVNHGKEYEEEIQKKKKKTLAKDWSPNNGC